MSITSVTVRGGQAPWVQAVVEWTGNSGTWRLSNIETQELLYYGSALRYDMTTVPEQIYHLDLADDVGNHQPFAYVAPPISAPVELVATDIDDTSAVLVWMPLAGVNSYELLVDGVSYNVLPEVPEAPTLGLGDLEPDRTYSAQIRAFMGPTASLWSPLMYFTTKRTTIAEASMYEYEPVLARTWRSAGWLPDGSDLIHGSGEAFNNANGIHTTVFGYSPNTLATIRQLRGVRVLAAEVSITRYPQTYSDPRMVLSHWMLHNMAALPAGAPTFVSPAMGLDSGSVALGQQAWMAIPTGWIDAILEGQASGFGWGGVTGRYMIAQPLKHEIRPKNGTLRITVG